MTPKFKKLAVKCALNFGIAAVIGYTIKMERRAEEHINDYFDEKDAIE